MDFTSTDGCYSESASDVIQKAPAMSSFDVVFVVSLSKLLNEQMGQGWWDAMTLRWRHCNEI